MIDPRLEAAANGVLDHYYHRRAKQLLQDQTLEGAMQRLHRALGAVAASPEDEGDAAIVEWFVRMQAEAEASHVIEAAAKAIADADGWDWLPDDPTDKDGYRETARKALAAARAVAAPPERQREDAWRAVGEDIGEAKHGTLGGGPFPSTSYTVDPTGLDED
jgi:hypothetical protein